MAQVAIAWLRYPFPLPHAKRFARAVSAAEVGSDSEPVAPIRHESRSSKQWRGLFASYVYEAVSH